MNDFSFAGCKILIVEDDFLQGADLAQMLKDEGATVIGPAVDLASAFEALNAQPQLAVLDLRLGQELSLPIADELSRRGVPFIFSAALPEQIPFCYGDVPVCEKPATHAEMRTLLAVAMQRTSA